jgi:hypothetical protein
MNRSHISFDNAVRYIAAYLGDRKAEKLYMDVSRFLATALDQLDLHIFDTIKSVSLPINDNMTVDLPKDMEMLTKVGVICGDGSRLRVIQKDDSLLMKGDEPIFKCCDCGEEENVTEQKGCDKCSFHNYSGVGINGGLMSVNYLYGYTPDLKKYGVYRHDVKNNRLVVGGGCGDIQPGKSVIVEYKTSLQEKEYILFPKKALQTLTHRVAQLHKAAGNMNASMAELRLFKIELSMLKNTLNTFTLQDMLNAIRSGYHSAPKR